MTPKLIIIAGFPGVGKSTVAKKLLKDLREKEQITAVLLDKDEITKGITPKIHEILGLAANDRESELHINTVRPLSHEILYNAASCVLQSGFSVLMDAPFEQYIQEDDWYPSLVKRFGLQPFVIWMEIPKELELERLKARGHDLDAWKISHFEEYYAARENMHLKVPSEYLYRAGQEYADIYNKLISFFQEK